MSLAVLDRVLATFWIDVLRHLWQTALVLLPLFVLAHVLRSAPARWSHRLWVAALVKLFVPMAVFGPLVGAALRKLLAGDTLAPRHGAFDGLRVFVNVIGADSASGIDLAGAWVPAPFWTAWTAIYLVIAGGLLMRTGRDLIAARRLAHASVPLLDDRRARLDRAIERAGVSARRVCVSESNVLPSVVGTTRPRIVLPIRLLDALDVDELEAVLLHEEMHRRNGDTFLSVVQRIASAILFFFPLLGPMQRRLREAAEMRCDEDALRAGAEPRVYARALARTIRLGLEPSPAPAALGDGNPSIVARRLSRLFEPRRNRTMTKHRLAIAGAGTVLAAGIFLPIAPSRITAGTTPVNSELGLLSSNDRRVSLQFDNVPAVRVLQAIASAGRFQLFTEGSEDCCLVSVSLADVPLRQALEAVAAQVDLRYEVVDFKNLRVKLPSPRLPSAGIELPKLLTRVEPTYPKDARMARVQGTVVLQVALREDGTVGDVQVLRGVSGWPSFDEAAVAAVRQWTYAPAMEDGRPVSIYYTVVVKFYLR